MSYLHPYPKKFLNPPFQLLFLAYMVFQFPSRVVASTSAQASVTAGSGNVDLVFPTFNDSTFSCTGSPPIVGYFPCKFNLGGSCDFLAPKYNYLYPNQSARLMYKQSIEFNVPTHQVASVNFSTFILFQVSHVPNKTTMGAGIAFIIAPTIDTPLGSEGGGLGLYINNTIPDITSPGVIAIEFDTSYTPGIDKASVGIPHIGLDDGTLHSVSLSVIGSEFLDTPVGMWIDYDDNASTLSIYSTPVQGIMDASAANLKPKTPLFIQESFNVFATSTDFKRGYIGISGGIDNGGWENNKIFYWRFTTTGYPPPATLSSWYVWYGSLSTTSKLAVIVGSLLGTLAGAFGCSECIFHLFCQRVKKSRITKEKSWPYHWRTSLPGSKIKKVPSSHKKVRDSLSMTTPLYLWEAPAEPQWKHNSDVESPNNLEVEFTNNQAPLISPMLEAEQGYNQDSEVDISNEVDVLEIHNTGALVDESIEIDAIVMLVKGEEVETQAQDVDQSSMAFQEKVSIPKETPLEIEAPMQRIVPTVTKEKAQDGKETKLLPTKTKAFDKKPIQLLEDKQELGSKMRLKLGKTMAPMIEKKLVHAPQKKLEIETKIDLKEVKKTTPHTEKISIQVGKGSASIESLKVPPIRKAITQLENLPSLEIQKPLALDKRVKFEAESPSELSQQRRMSIEKKTLPMAIQLSFLPKQEPMPTQTKQSSHVGQPSSLSKQSPLPKVEKVSPLVGQPSSLPNHGPLSIEKKVSPLVGQPSLLPKQSALLAQKKVSPPTRQPSSPPKQEAMQGAKKVILQVEPKKGASHVVDPQSSLPKGLGLLQIPKTKLLKGPRQSPQMSPRIVSPQGSQRAIIPQPSLETSQTNASPTEPLRDPQPSPQTSKKSVQ